ncbi:dihydrofolate reductase family protein [Candidatus Nomurabacteria bacterium]|nr:dihydrofolate reductase family protein [Candidatus Kaiserbacteria bacterium]MCB9814494.1 dihydrofolate reductase family protein [Candidatus Nomurabacteria bacterium]
MERPYITLFLLMSVDGKISTGDTEVLDFDLDFKEVEGLKEGLGQYYKLEQETDLCSINSGRVLKKVGVNCEHSEPEKTPVSYVVIDSKPHLNVSGVKYLAGKSDVLYIVTNNSEHPAFELVKQCVNIRILKHEGEIDLSKTLKLLKNDFGIERATIQTGGTLNSEWTRRGLIDRLLLVVAPVLIGGESTPTLVDGESLHVKTDLALLKTLELVSAKPLANSYLLLEYKVKN